MENKEKNSEKEKESDKPEVKVDKKAESKPEKKSSKADKSTEESKDTSKLETDMEALKGSLSGKDKKLKTVEDQLVEANDRLDKIENQSKVKDLLLESDHPEAVQQALKKDLGTLTPETFEAKADEYNSLYEQGRDEQKAKNANFVSKKPEPKTPEDFKEKLDKVTSKEELEELVKESGM